MIITPANPRGQTELLQMKGVNIIRVTGLRTDMRITTNLQSLTDQTAKTQRALSSPLHRQRQELPAPSFRFSEKTLLLFEQRDRYPIKRHALASIDFTLYLDHISQWQVK